MTVAELIKELGKFDGDLKVATIDDNELIPVAELVIAWCHPESGYSWKVQRGDDHVNPEYSEKYLLL